MVANDSPAFLSLATGSVIGKPIAGVPGKKADIRSVTTSSQRTRTPKLTTLVAGAGVSLTTGPIEVEKPKSDRKERTRPGGGQARVTTRKPPGKGAAGAKRPAGAKRSTGAAEATGRLDRQASYEPTPRRPNPLVPLGPARPGSPDPSGAGDRPGRRAGRASVAPVRLAERPLPAVERLLRGGLRAVAVRGPADPAPGDRRERLRRDGSVTRAPRRSPSRRRVHRIYDRDGVVLAQSIDAAKLHGRPDVHHRQR